MYTLYGLLHFTLTERTHTGAAISNLAAALDASLDITNVGGRKHFFFFLFLCLVFQGFFFFCCCCGLFFNDGPDTFQIQPTGTTAAGGSQTEVSH